MPEWFPRPTPGRTYPEAARVRRAWHDSQPLEWEHEVDRFIATPVALDAHLASDAPLHAPPESNCFSGPSQPSSIKISDVPAKGDPQQVVAELTLKWYIWPSHIGRAALPSFESSAQHAAEDDR